MLKQMKLIYAQGFSKTEKLEWKPVVFNNIVQSFRLIFDAMHELDLEFENKENEASNIRTAVPCIMSAAGSRRAPAFMASGQPLHP